MKKIFLVVLAVIAASMLPKLFAENANCNSDDNSSTPLVEKVYNQTKEGTVTVYDKVADWTENACDDVADWSVDAYHTAKDGLVKGYNAVKDEFNKIF